MPDHHCAGDKLHAYHEGILSADERRALERHLATCAACQTQLAHASALARVPKKQFGNEYAPLTLRTAVRSFISSIKLLNNKLVNPAHS